MYHIIKILKSIKNIRRGSQFLITSLLLANLTTIYVSANPRTTPFPPPITQSSILTPTPTPTNQPNPKSQITIGPGYLTVYNTDQLMWAQVEYHAGFRGDKSPNPDLLRNQVLQAQNLDQIEQIPHLITNPQKFQSAQKTIPNFFESIQTTFQNYCMLAVDTKDFSTTVPARKFIGLKFQLTHTKQINPQGQLIKLDTPQTIDCVNWDVLADHHRISGEHDKYFVDINPGTASGGGYQALGAHWNKQKRRITSTTGQPVSQVPQPIITFNTDQLK